MDSVDLETATGSRITGLELGLRILLAVAEHCDANANSLAGELDTIASSAGLVRLQAQLDRLESSVSPLRRRGRPTETAWLPVEAGSQDADGVAQILDDALARLRAAKEEAIRREIRLRADSERRDADALQLFLGTIAAVLLGPSLVASIFAAFPSWQPVSRRDNSFVGLSLASGGALWLVVYAIRALMSRRRRSPLRSVALVGVGLIPLIVGLIVALPLHMGLDGTSPEISVRCPERPIMRGLEASAVVAASDAESGLAADPSGAHPLSTKAVGAITRTFKAVDKFGRAVSASCTYVVSRPSQPPASRSAPLPTGITTRAAGQ